MVKLFLKVVFIVAIVVSAGCGPDYSLAPAEPANIPPTSEWPQNWPSKACSPVELKLFEKNRAFSETWNSCSRGEWGDKEKTRNCIRTHYKLATPCATCFAEFTACGKDNCSKLTCWRDSVDCRKCGWKNCGSQLERCFGFSRKVMYEWY